MARLPDDTALGPLDAAGSGRPIATYDTSGYARGAAAMGEGAKDLGAGIMTAGKGLAAYASQAASAEQKLQLARVNAELTAKELARTNAIEGETELVGMVERHKRAAAREVNQATQRISDPKLQADLLLHSDGYVGNVTRVAQQREKVLDTSIGVANDWGLIDTLRYEALKSKDPSAINRAASVFEGIVDGWIDNNLVDPEKGVSIKQNWASDVAERALLEASPTDRLAAIAAAANHTQIDPAAAPAHINGEASGNQVISQGPSELTILARMLSTEVLTRIEQSARFEIDRTVEIRAADKFVRIGQLLEEADRGQTALPGRHVIENEPELSPAFKSMLLQKYDIAAENSRIFDIAKKNAATPDYVWNANSAADKRAISILDTRFGVVSGIASGDPQMRGVAVKRFAATGMVSDEVRGTLNGMIRSGNEQKIEFAMSTLDHMQRTNQSGFREAFDQETAKALVAYQQLINHPPGSFQAWLKRSNDPTLANARENATARGRRVAENVSDQEMMAVHDESWLSDPGKPMGNRDAPGVDVYRQQWTSLFAEGYASFDGDVETAKKFANEWIKQTWSVSDVNGGRLTMFAPEKAAADLRFPTVNGSFDWMKQQVQEAIRSQVQPPPVEDPNQSRAAKIRERRRTESSFPEKYWLVPDENTRSEIEILKAGYQLPNDRGRRSPTWTLVYIDPKTNYPKQARFYFDVKAAAVEQGKLRQDRAKGDQAWADKKNAYGQRIAQQNQNWRRRATGFDTSPIQGEVDAP